MKTLKFIAANIFETILRLLPVPCKTGLLKIGNPGKNSPVFLTCNYHLTVQRVKRALEGMDAYLLVANSRGINVWCAVSGGHLTNHDVVSVLKTSGIEELVEHSQVILPQLAATGVEAKIIKKKTGWRIIWGPVYAEDIPIFMKNKMKKDEKMRKVKFPLIQRFEMAVAWAFPISLVAGIVAVLFSPGILIPLVLMVWGLSLIIFISFPLYSSWLNSKKKNIGFIFFDFGRGGFSLFFWALILLALMIYAVLTRQFYWKFLFRWGFLSFIVIIILSIDLKGSTPLFKSGLHEQLRVSIDEEKCRGAGFCETVCPRNCYEVDRENHLATLPGAERCICCGACIVQCPFDALYFVNPKGEVILPETMRKYKQNLVGKRVMKTGDKR